MYVGDKDGALKTGHTKCWNTQHSRAPPNLAGTTRNPWSSIWTSKLEAKHCPWLHGIHAASTVKLLDS